MMFVPSFCNFKHTSYWRLRLLYFKQIRKQMAYRVMCVVWLFLRWGVYDMYICLYICMNKKKGMLTFSSVQLLNRVWLWDPPCTAALQVSLSITNSRSLLTHARCIGDVIQSSHPLPSPSPPAHNPSQHQGLFQWVSSLHQVAKVL